MILNYKGAFAVCFIGPAHFAVDPGVVVYEVAIMVDSQAEGFGKRSILLEDGCFIKDIVGLPVTRCPAGIDQGGVLPVDRPTGAISKGIVLKTVENLEFISRH